MAVTQKKKKQLEHAAAITAAAAGIATTVIATAAADANKAVTTAAAIAAETLAAAAEKATKVVAESAARALAEFPELKEDIREIRAGQMNTVNTLTTVMTELIEARTSNETKWQEGLTKSVDEIKNHMKTQNGRLDKAEKHITRQNLVIFGIAGPICLGLLLYTFSNLLQFFLAGGFHKFLIAGLSLYNLI